MRRSRAEQVRRRTLLRGAVLAPFAGVAAGCGDLARTAGLGDYVRVAVSWSAAELAAFDRVLGRRGTHDYELVPLGDDIGAALGANTAGRPDVVALPQPGHVAGSLPDLEPLPPEVWRPYYDEIWSAELPSAAGQHYALPFKIAHASVVWYRKRTFDEYGLEPPATWQDWLELNETIIEHGDLAPLALGGADGWLLARFFENALLRTFAGAYDELTGAPDPAAWGSADVRAAFEMVATMWSRPGALAGGADRALVQQFPDAVLEVFRYGRAAMVVAPDFAESVVRRFGSMDDVDTFTFPGTGPLVISGDLLVVTRPASRATLRLIRYLATPEAPVPWITETGGFIAANPETDSRHYSPTLRRLAGELRDADTRFGLSDQIGRLGGSEGLQRVLQNLLRGLASGVAPADAARTAADRMVEAVRQAE